MKIIGRKILEDLKAKHADVKSQVDSWLQEASEAEWSTPAMVKKRYVAASILQDNHVIFNIKGNKYRLKVQISYQNHIIFIKNAGTHSEYLKW